MTAAAALAIPGDGPLFEGHFPGRPILPGIVLLHLALRAASPGRAPAPHGIESLRFRRLVTPGEQLQVELTAGDAAGRAALAVRRGPERVAEAVLRPGAARPDAAPATGGSTAAVSTPLPDGLLPHRGPALFVVAVASSSDDGVVCAARVPEAHPLVADGRAPAYVAIEVAAQAAGVFEALRRAAGAPAAGASTAAIGYLVGARDVCFERPDLPAGVACVAAVRLAGVVGPLTAYEFEVRCAGRRLAAGRVSAWLPATAS